jgi:hypothetical protein
VFSRVDNPVRLLEHGALANLLAVVGFSLFGLAVLVALASLTLTIRHRRAHTA